MPESCRTPLGARSRAAGLLLLVLVAGCASHDYETYVAELDGALEGVTTPARGRAVVLLSRADDRADITLSVTAFANPITGAFVRQAPRGQTGGVVFTLWRPGQGPFDAEHPILRVWDRSGGAAAVPGGDVSRSAEQSFGAEMLRALRAGELYVNVTTRDRPSGEVRGQLLPE